MLNNKMLNGVLKSLFVAKINLPEFLPEKLVKLELYPNTNDCFLVSQNTCDRMSAMFRRPSETELTRIKPSCGSKMIGAFRDKGSITQVMDRFVPFVKYECKSELEVERLAKALEEMRGEDTFYIQDKNTLFFQIDVIANPSTGRDNVSALILQSCLELEGIFDDEIKEYTLKEVGEMNVEEVIKRRQHEHEVVIYDKENNTIVHNFGKVPILLEDFFWQPKHDNSLYCQEKEFSCTYSQFKDGLQVLIPSLYKSLQNSLDYESIHEHCLILGMDLVTDSNKSIGAVSDHDPSYDDDEFDYLDDLC